MSKHSLPSNNREALYILLTEEAVGMPVYGLALVAMIFVGSMQMRKAMRVTAHAVTLVLALLFVISCILATGIA